MSRLPHRMDTFFPSLDGYTPDDFATAPVYPPPTEQQVRSYERLFQIDASQVRGLPTDGAGITLPTAGRIVPTVSQYLKNNSTFNIRDFGAVGDGVADDTAAIQAAVNAAYAVGGGLVTIPAGTYRVSRTAISSAPGSACGGYAVQMKSGVSVVGEGFSSIIRNTGMVPGVSPTDNATWYSAFECPDGTHDLVIKGVRFVGQNNPFVNSLTYYQRQMDCIGMRGASCHDILVTDCTFDDQYGFTVHLEGDGQRVHVTDCLMRNCANGLNVNSQWSMQIRNTLVDCESIEATGAFSVYAHNLILRPTENGISIGGYTSPGHIPGCVVAHNTIVDGLNSGIGITDAVEGAVIHGNIIVRAAVFGIALISGGWNPVKRVRVASNYLLDCGKIGAAARIAIFCQNNPGGSIDGNIIDYGDTAGYDTQFGINIAADASGLRVAGNQIRASFRAISNASPNVLVGDDNVLDWGLVEQTGAGAFMPRPHRDGAANVAFPGGSTNVTINPTLGNLYRLAITDASPFTIYPTFAQNGVDAAQTQRITIMIRNATSGAVPAISFYNGAGGFRTSAALTAPAAGNWRSISFFWDQSANFWIEESRSAADV